MAEHPIGRTAGGGPGARSCACWSGTQAGRSAGDVRRPARDQLANVEAAAIEALEELADWELEAMRDPRNWVRPVAAVAVGTAAGAALVVLGLRSRRRRASGLRAIAEQSGKVGRGAVSSARGLIR